MHAQAPSREAPAGERVLELSLNQEGLWFLGQYDSGSGAYNLSLAFRIVGDFQPQACEWALNQLVARHQALRTRIVLRDGQPWQSVAPEATIALHRESFAAQDDAGQQLERARQSVRAQARRPFDLARELPVRAAVFSSGARQHVLVLVVHHIVSDGWSLGVLVRELSELYSARVTARAPRLAEEPLQYPEYARWQRRRLAGGHLQKLQAYWRGQLAGAPPALQLPGDRPRPPVRGSRGAVLHHAIPGSTMARLQEIGREAHSTLFMTLLAAFNVLLLRHGGQRDICIGTPVANRARVELEPVVGLFVNTVVLRTRMRPGMPFAELLQAVRDTCLQAYTHQELPFGEMVRLAAPQRTQAHHPLFQAMFVLQNTPRAPAKFASLQVQPLPADGGRTKFDLTLSVVPRQGYLTGEWEYAQDIFDEATVQRMAERFNRLLAGICTDPQQSIDALPVLGDLEYTQLRSWNATEAESPGGQVLHAMFEAQAARTPDAVALLFEDEQLSYAQLNARANRLAHHLRALGVGPDVLVAVCAERSLAMVVALMAVLKAGGAYVPLDPAYPAERIAFMLEDARPAALLTQEALLSLLPVHEVPTFCLDSQWDSLPTRDANPACATLPAHLAYVIYTSGSTGRPKGVGIQQRNACAFLAWSASVFDSDALSMTLASTSICFDLSVFEIFAPLACGASVCIVPNALALASGSFQHPVTLVNTVPSAMAALLRANALPASVRTVNLAGEPLSAQLVQQAYQQPQVRQLFNLYGPTEDTVYSTWALVPSDEGAAVTIGRPIANSQVHILDESFSLVPQGVPGELCLAGDGLARGYIGRPELTAERFVPNPHGKPGERMYRTGDLARWLGDGSIEYLGRIDQQVKIRGFRIEPGEIEAVLAAQAGVREAVVLAREDVPGDKRLVAYVVPQAGVQLEATDLRTQLQRQLPDYMVPAHLLVLDALPLTPNGKTDRKALPAPEPVRGGQGYVAPRTPAEATMAAAWSDVLGIDRVGVHDNFFALGGHSLLIVKLVERLRAHGLRIDVRNVIAAPTLADLAGLAGQRAAQAFAAPPNLIPADCAAITPAMLPLVQLDQTQIDRIVAHVPASAANVQDIYPLAPLQEGILFHHRLETTGDTYILRLLLSFENSARLDRFLDALRVLIGCHDVLRTSVHWQELPRAVQVVQRSAELPVHWLPAPDGTGEPDALARLLHATDPGRLRMALDRAPLVAAHVTAEGDAPDGRRLLALLAHHIVIDHVSLDLCMLQIRQLLGGGAAPRPSAPYRDFVAAAGAVSDDAHASYFRRQLGDVNAPCAPFGLLDVHMDGYGVRTAAAPVAPAMGMRIRETARRLGVSPAVLFHVAWAQVVARCGGGEDVVFGTVLSGRQGLQDAGETLGLFINTLPVRLPLRGRGVRGVVQEAHQRLGELMLHEQASLALAQRCSGVPPGLPLFTSVLNYRHTSRPPREEGAGGSAPAGRLLRFEEQTNYPLVLNVSDFGEAFTLSAQSAGQVDASRIAAYAQQTMQGLLDALADTGDVPMQRIDVLPPDERAQLLREAGAAHSDQPRGQVLHQLFEQQVAAIPQAVALAFEDEELTYAELNVRANRLAHHLRSLGVGPDVLVAVCAERSLAMVVALMAVLKAGGAYVPLDPAYPVERLAFMLADARPAVLLTQEALVASLPAHEVPTFCLDSQWDSLPARDSNPPCTTLPAHLAYVIYTSGSTGQPKGVGGTVLSVVNRLLWMQAMFPSEPGQTHLQKTSLNFIDSLTETLAPLLFGATLRIAPRSAADVQELWRLVEHHRVARLVLVPSLLAALLQDGQLQRGHTPALIVCSGEALAQRLAGQALESMPGSAVLNLYGSSEVAGDVTFHVCAATDAAARGEAGVPIGRPIANTRVHVLDAAFNLVAQGVPGELYIAGDGLARGYVNRPALTAERFVPNPYGPSGSRMYRTGDLARWLADGSLEYLGRIDQQVKIRGFRIEPGEIEAALASRPGVREAVVLAREDSPGDKRLVAYVVPQAGITIEAGEIRAQLQSRLPEYMVPAHFVVLESLPLTPNGKLDRRSLPAPDLRGGEAGYIAPATPTEAAVASIWAEVLRLERVGVQDNFFALGGHSLLATQVLAKLRAALRVELPLRALFEAPTVAQLALRVQHARQAVGGEIEPVPRDQPLALSYAQQRLWFIDQLEPGGTQYNMSVALRLRGALSVDALRGAFEALLARHEVLRTRFVVPAGAREAVQEIAPVQPFDLSVEDASEEDVGRHAREHSVQPFDLARGPLLKARLLRLGAHEHVLLLNVHHIASDGWSHAVMTRDMQQLYAAQLGRVAELPALPVQYADYAAWQRAQDLSADLAYWKQALAGYEDSLELPYDHARPAGRAWTASVVRHRFDPALVQRLAQFAQGEHATLFMALLAALAVVLQRYSGRTDLCIGTTVAGRERAQLQDLIGFFINIVPLRLDLQNCDSARSLLRHVRSVSLDALEHQALPFEHLLNELQLTRDASRIALVPVVVRHQNFPAARMGDWADLQVTRLPGAPKRATSELDLMFFGDASALELQLEYATELFDHATIERMVSHLEAVLREMVAPQALPMAQWQVLAQGEQELFARRNDTAREIDAACVPQLFARQVTRTPEAVASTDTAGSLTYAQLGAQVNRLAGQLRARGVGLESRVVLLLERGNDLLAGMLAVMKAGGCCVPLDVQHPDAYLRSIMDDARVDLVVSSGALSARAGGLPMLCVDSNDAVQDAAAVQELRPEHLALLMYTSGSTGRPKGVMVPHWQLLNWLHALWQRTPFEPGEVVAQKTSAAFAVSTKELLSGLLCGTPVAFIDDATARDARAFARALHDSGATRLNLVPSHLGALLQALQQDGQQQLLAKLRHCTTAGEPLTRQLHAQMARELPWVQLWNNYGCTELNDVSYCAPGQMGHGSGFVPIGLPIANTEVFVLDSALRPCPIGVVGELCVHSLGMARGYWGQPALTAERFIPHLFSREPGARLYRTGDMVRRLADGSLEYVQRRDFQIKIRGNRIDVRQVEQWLSEQPQVAQAVVAAWPPEDQAAQLVAYVVTLDGQPPDGAQLRETLSERLPGYMVPSLFVQLPALPRLANGKLDRRALPAAHAQLATASIERIAPRTPTEQQLLALWSELLTLPPKRIGIHDSFFHLGGHSLLATQLVSRIRATLAVEVPLSAVFTHSSLAALATVIDTRHATPRSLVVPLQASAGHPPLFCIHPVGGEISFYAALGEQLKDRFTVYGLQSPEAAGMSWRFDSLQAMATAYADTIIAIQPDGPCRLLGWSSGGLIAMWVAAALEQRQRQVDYLGLVDTASIGRPPGGAAGLEALAAFIVASTVRGAPLDLREIARARQRNRDAGVPLLESLSGMAMTPADPLRRQADATRHHLDLLLRATPAMPPLRAKPCFYRAQHTHLETSGIEAAARVVRIVPGATHHGVLREPHASELAAALAADLDHARFAAPPQENPTP
ncbi:MAG: amino acid adenylation domain-containing protein [Pseudomonadota bacterium]